MKISRIKEFKNFCLAAAILVAGASLASCSSSDDSIIENQQPTNGKYTMTINASKGDGATTRALEPGENHTLNATWAMSENVYVKKGETWASNGSLQPETEGKETVLKGNITMESGILSGDDLTLQFPRRGDITYAGQVGTLADIEANFDYATATVKVASISASGNINPVDAKTTFTNQQAIVKFTLIDKADGNTHLSVRELVVNDGTTNYTITPASATDVIYVAIPGFSDKTVTLTATVDNDTYTYEKSGVTFTNGQYYEINVKMYKYIATGKNVSNEDMNVPTGEHWYITGSSNTHKITIADGAAVTLAGVTINSHSEDGGYNGESYCIKCEGNATIILADNLDNSLTSNGPLPYPALWVGGEGTTLTIKGETAGTGKLIAQTKYTCAGIGGGFYNNNKTCGNIVIEGGSITAIGGIYAAGIGSDGGGKCGNITIKGGTIVATGGLYGAGIGSGYEGKCDNITIWNTVTQVTAKKADNDTATPNSIGRGCDAEGCGTVTIGGTIYWTGSAYENNGDTYLTQSTLVYSPVQ